MSASNSNKELFETWSIPRSVFVMAVPTVITQLINVVYNFADTWYVGRTQNAAMVATLGVCFPLFVILSAIANLFGVGGSSVISRSLGAGKPKRARHAFAFCFYGGLALSAVYMLIMILFRGRIILLAGGDANDFQYAYDYIFWTMILGAVPTVGNVLCGHLVRSIGASREAGFGMSMGGILNMILDPLFMFVLLPAGHEVTGAAIATFLSNTAAFVYFLIYLYRHRDHEVLTLRPSEISVRDRIPGDVLMIGLPAALSTTLAMVSNMVANNLVRTYGSEAVAGMGVAKKINMIAFNTCMGVTQGVLPLLGYCYGARNFTRMKKIIRFTGTVVLAYGLTCTTVFRIFSRPLVRFFIDQERSVEYGSMFLKVIAVASPLAALCYTVNTVFQAAGRKFRSFLLSILRKGVLDIPGMILLEARFGAIGIVWATPIAEILSVGIAAVLYFNLLRSLLAGG